MKTVLLIESEPTKLVALSLILRSLGYAVLEAGTRGKAWSACHQHKGPIHLVVLDEDKSNEFVARLQILYPQIRAILVSDVSQARNMPCEYTLLQRPVRVETLIDTMKALLDRPGMSAIRSC